MEAPQNTAKEMILSDHWYGKIHTLSLEGRPLQIAVVTFKCGFVFVAHIKTDSSSVLELSGTILPKRHVYMQSN